MTPEPLTSARTILQEVAQRYLSILAQHISAVRRLVIHLENEMTGDAQARYSLGAIIFHWLIAIAVIVNWRIAEYAEGGTDAEELAIMANHKALGIIILALSVLRLGWRFTHQAPPLSEPLDRKSVV